MLKQTHYWRTKYWVDAYIFIELKIYYFLMNKIHELITANTINQGYILLDGVSNDGLPMMWQFFYSTSQEIH